MPIHIVKNFLGVFALDTSGAILDHALFPKDPEKIASRLSGTCREEEELKERLEKKHKGVEIAAGQPEDFRKLALENGWVKSNQEYNELLSRTNILITKGMLKKEKRDKVLMHAVTTLDEIDKEINVLSEKLREWYGLHFPEMLRAVGSNERFAGIVSSFGRKEDIKDKEISSIAKKSAGMEMSPDDIEAIQRLSSGVLALVESRKNISQYIEKTAQEDVPNMSAVAGPALACRLMALGGGLDKLARMPSSTIQLLGSEKALFRHLRGEGKAPKYGILFSHQLVQNAPRELKGKVARHVAAKTSLAAKMDFFSKKDRGKHMKEDLERQVSHILGK